MRSGAALRALLSNFATADFVSSPLGRARETMEIVRRELALPPERYAIDDRIKELNYGHWEGMLQDDLNLIDPHGLAAHGGVSRCLRAHLLGLDPSCIPDLEGPQDRVLVLRDGEMRWI